MARRRSGGKRRGRGRGWQITPKKVAIAAPAIAGAITAIKVAYENHKFYNPKGTGISNPLGFIGVNGGYGGKALSVDRGAAMHVAVPLIGGAVASKGVAVGLKFAGKAGGPLVNRALNYKIAKV